MKNKYPKCIGNFSKCPLEKRIFCVKDTINVAEKCRRLELIKNDKIKYKMYTDLNGKIWVCNKAKIKNGDKK